MSSTGPPPSFQFFEILPLLLALLIFIVIPSQSQHIQRTRIGDTCDARQKNYPHSSFQFLSNLQFEFNLSVQFGFFWVYRIRLWLEQLPSDLSSEPPNCRWMPLQWKDCHSSGFPLLSSWANVLAPRKRALWPYAVSPVQNNTHRPAGQIYWITKSVRENLLVIPVAGLTRILETTSRRYRIFCEGIWRPSRRPKLTSG